MKRNPSVTYRKPEAVTKASATVNSLNVSIWFDGIVEYLERKNLLEHFEKHPENKINLDESGVDLNAIPKKVFTLKSLRHTLHTESSKHHCRITITMAISAAGAILPTQIIYKNSYSRMADSANAAIGNLNEGIFRTLNNFRQFSLKMRKLIFSSRKPSQDGRQKSHTGITSKS